MLSDLLIDMYNLNLMYNYILCPMYVLLSQWKTCHVRNWAINNKKKKKKKKVTQGIFYPVGM